MDNKFEEMFEEKFGSSIAESSKFTTKAIMYEGWILHKEFMNDIVREIDSETNKGE